MRKPALFITVLVFFLTAVGHGGSGGSLSDCNRADYDIYLGYYTENEKANPEDPTSGLLVACMPSSSGTFKTQFLFSYYGCMGGIDYGTVNGSRTKDRVGGTWSGTVDGVGIGGGFNGSWDGAKFSGIWDNRGGKVRVQVGSCRYYVAPNGHWWLYPLNSDEGGLNISVSGRPPQISWNNTISGVKGFLISVYDKRCVYNKISLAHCTMWALGCVNVINSIHYGTTPLGCMVFYPAKPLKSNLGYIISITAYGSSQSDVKAFATKVFTAP